MVLTGILRHADGEDDVVSIADHIVVGLLWLSFGAVHSLLAGEWAKRSLRRWLGGG